MTKGSAETKWTKGPWSAITREGSWDWVVYTDHDANIEICQMFHDGTRLNEIGEANARLVAASPALYEALKAIVDAFGVGQSDEAFLRQMNDVLIPEAQKACKLAEEGQ